MVALQQFSARTHESGWISKSIAAEIALVLLAYITSIFVLTYSYKSGGLYNDNLTFFALFRDNAYSLNRFGEPAWWLPHINFGQPGYIATALGPHGFSPGSMLFGLVVWVLGAAGYMISDFRHLYVAYAFVLLPTIFMGCAWVLSREFQNRFTRMLVFSMSAFAPILIQTVSDPGAVEIAAYSLLCIACVLRYIRCSTERAFFLVVFAFSLLFHSLTYIFIFWGIPFVVILCWALFGTRSLRKLAVRALSRESKIRIALGFTAIVIAALPFLMVHTGVREFSNLLVGAGYDVNDLVPGNPLQLLMVSTPGVFFQWDFYRPSAAHPIVQFFPHPFGPTLAYGYAYMGIACLPLVLVGLVYGRRALSWRLGVIALVLFSVVIMSGFSPFYALFATASRFMLANNHYSDGLFYSGAGFIPMFLAVLGFDRIVNGHRRASRLALLTLIPTALSAIALLIYLNRESPAQFGSVLGFVMLTALVTAYGLYGAGNARTQVSLRRYSWLLVTIVLIDIATIGFWQIRSAINPSTSVKDLLATTPDSLEVLHRQATRGARNLLVRKEHIPLLRGRIEMKPLVELPASRGSAVVTRRTFNEMTIKTSASQGTNVLVRDAWDPHWTATVNGKPTAIQKAGIFKSIAIPGGKTEIKLRFSPDRLKAMLVISYLALLIVAVLSTGLIRSRRRTTA